MLIKSHLGAPMQCSVEFFGNYTTKSTKSTDALRKEFGKSTNKKYSGTFLVVREKHHVNEVAGTIKLIKLIYFPRILKIYF